MGGQGSGRWTRGDTKTTTESQRCIDIRWLKKQNYLHPGVKGTLLWSRNGKQNGSVQYKIELDRMILGYSCRFNDEGYQYIEEVVHFAKTYCNYGGHRKWFLCPHCYKRVAVIYGAGKRFLCRHCYNLTYASKNEDRASRQLRKAENIRKKLGGSRSDKEPFPRKPKNMHWQTYWKLLDEGLTAEELGWLHISQKFGISLK